MRVISLSALLSVTLLPLSPGALASSLKKEVQQRAARESHRLLHSLEDLQEAILEQWHGRREQKFFLRIDAILESVETMHKELIKNRERVLIYQAHQRVDDQLDKLFDSLRKMNDSPEAPRGMATIMKHVQKVESHDDELYYLLSLGDVAPKRQQRVIQRQASQMASHARELLKGIQYLTGTRLAKAIPRGFEALVEATEAFEKSAARGLSKEQMRASFAAVNKAWARCIQNLETLKLQQSRYLIRKSGALDRCHARIYRLLEMKGERPQLSLGA